MLNVRVITLAVTLAISGAALTAAPLASANSPVAAARATDDHHGLHAEPGDDNGLRAQPGDDNGLQAEPGDDNGLQAQPGDDKGSDVTASTATGATKTTTAAKAKRHTHIRHASHRLVAR
jgi:hypothetical protein